MAHDAFISYSSEDKTTADAVVARLESKGVRCWVAPRDVLPGMNYAQAISEGIADAAVMILVFSAHTNRSQAVINELEVAVNRGIAVLPFRIEDVAPSGPIEYYIRARHWLDALTPPLDRHLDELATTVALLLKRLRETSAGPPAGTGASTTFGRGPRSPYTIGIRPNRRSLTISAAVLLLALIAAVAAGLMITWPDSGQPSTTEDARSSSPTFTPLQRTFVAQAVAPLASPTAIPTAISAPPPVNPAPSVQVASAAQDESAPPASSPTPAVVQAAAPPTCSGGDFDGDGVCQSSDLCSSTNSAWFPVDAQGCAQREVDFDLDNVCDPGAESAGPNGCSGNDLCRNTNSSWFPVDAQGCAQREVDFDLDNVCDPGAVSAGPAGCSGTDLCPNTNPAWRPVNADGCAAQEG